LDQTAGKRTRAANFYILSYVRKVLIANVNLKVIKTNVNFFIHGRRKRIKMKKISKIKFGQETKMKNNQELNRIKRKIKQVIKCLKSKLKRSHKTTQNKSLMITD
jgi:hypothetical protein